MIGVLGIGAVDCALHAILFTFLPVRTLFHLPDLSAHFTSCCRTFLSFATLVLLRLPHISSHMALFIGLALPCSSVVLCAAC